MKNGVKMKIIFFMSHAYYFFDKKKGNRIGGAELNMVNIAKSLSLKKNCNIEFWTGDCNQNSIEKFNNITIRKIPFLFENKRNIFSKILTRVFFMYYSFISQGDIFITSTRSDFFILWFFIVKLLKNKTIFFRVGQDIDVNGVLNNNISLYGILYKLALKKSDKIIVQSFYQKNCLIKLYNKKSILIRNSHIIQTPEHFQKREFICWIGRCRLVKNPELFLKLAKKMPNYKFIMILSEKNNLRDKILKKSSTIKNLTILESLDRNEVLNILKKSKCLINTSKREGFSNTWIESFMCGTPVLSYKVNPDNILKKYNLGKHTKNSIEKTINFIKNLSTEKQKFYFKKTTKYVAKYHNIKNASEVYYKLISMFNIKT